jgi:hypothetical protein
MTPSHNASDCLHILNLSEFVFVWVKQQRIGAVQLPLSLKPIGYSWSNLACRKTTKVKGQGFFWGEGDCILGQFLNPKARDTVVASLAHATPHDVLYLSRWDLTWQPYIGSCSSAGIITIITVPCTGSARSSPYHQYWKKYSFSTKPRQA